MADSKISALTALTGTPADDDVFAVVDTSATATKKITFATLNDALKRWTVKTANYTAVASDKILANTAAGAWTLTLPASPAVGDEIHILDAAASFDDNTLTVARNSLKIQGLTADLSLTTQNTGIGLVYMSATYGWRVLIDAYDVVTTEL